MKKALNLLVGLLLFLLLITLSACSGNSTQTTATESTETPAEETTVIAAADPSSTATESPTPAMTEVTVTDMVGRDVTIPAEIDSLCSTGQPGAVLLYTLCPERLIAWNSEISEDALSYILEDNQTLPVIGSMQGGKSTASKEEIVTLAPDVIIYMTTINSKTADTADSIQESMGVPVITVSFDITSIGESYRFLGELLGCEDRAEELGTYCDDIIAEISEKAATIAEEDSVTFYYTSGGSGLQTSPGGSSHTEIIELAGGVNVVDLEAESNGRLKVNMEQILVWDPDVIITAPSDTSIDVYSQITADTATWSSVAAVTEGNIYASPVLPFSWLDAPVSVNRVMGLVWAAETLYPDVYDYDINACAKEFYSMFYGCDLTDEQIEAIY